MGLVGGKGYSGRQEKDWTVHLREYMSAFGIIFQGWRNGARRRTPDGYDG